MDGWIYNTLPIVVPGIIVPSPPALLLCSKMLYCSILKYESSEGGPEIRIVSSRLTLKQKRGRVVVLIHESSLEEGMQFRISLLPRFTMPIVDDHQELGHESEQAHKQPSSCCRRASASFLG